MKMTSLERIRKLFTDRRYTLSEHAYDEMDADGLDVLDIEAAVLTGHVTQELTHDSRGERYVIVGTACDLTTPVGVVARFVENDHILVITVYEVR